MEDADLPIDPTECELKLTQVSPGYATLDIGVPARLVKRFHKKMRRAGAKPSAVEFTGTLLNFCVTQALKSSGVRVVTAPGIPEGQEHPVANTERDLRCTLQLDLGIELEVPDLSSLELKLPDATVTDEQIESEVRAQCQQFGKRVPTDAAERGAECVIDIGFQVAEGERPVLALEKVPVQIPLEGEMLLVQTHQVPGISSALCGMRAGESKTVRASFPLNHHSPLVRGKPALVTMRVHSINRVQPATPEEVIAQYGMPSVDRLRMQIRFALEDKSTRDAQAILRGQLAEALPDAVAVETPRVRTRMQHAVLERQMLSLLKARGMSDADAKAEHQRSLPDIQKRAERYARMRLILQSVSGKVGLVMDEDFVSGRVAALAAERGVRPEKLRAEMVQAGRFNDFVEDLSAEVVLDRLLEMGNPKIRHVSREEWERDHSAL